MKKMPFCFYKRAFFSMQYDIFIVFVFGKQIGKMLFFVLPSKTTSSRIMHPQYLPKGHLHLWCGCKTFVKILWQKNCKIPKAVFCFGNEIFSKAKVSKIPKVQTIEYLKYTACKSNQPHNIKTK